MKLLKRLGRVHTLTEPHRLPVTHNEPAFREKLPSPEHLAAIEKAREEWFQNTPQILKVDKKGKQE